MSCLGRERMFEHFSLTRGLAMAILRLNYAVEMRYGVLVDLARRVAAGETIDVTMGYFNAIWQADANAMALASLATSASPPLVLNIAGPEELSVRATCEQFARPARRRRSFTGQEATRRAAEQRRRARGRRSALLASTPPHSCAGPRLGAPGWRHTRQADPLRVARREVLVADRPISARDARARPRHPGTSARARQRRPVRRAPSARPHALLRRGRRRRPRGRRAHDAVRHPRPAHRPVRAGARARARGNGPRRRGRSVPLVRIGGICGSTEQALREADIAARLRLSRRSSQPRGADATRPTTS